MYSRGIIPDLLCVVSDICRAYAHKSFLERRFWSLTYLASRLSAKGLSLIPDGDVHLVCIRKTSLPLFTQRAALNRAETNQLWASLERAHTINLDHLSLLKTSTHKAPISLNQQLLWSLIVINKILITSDNKHAMNLHFNRALRGFTWRFLFALTPTRAISGNTTWFNPY